MADPPRAEAPPLSTSSRTWWSDAARLRRRGTQTLYQQLVVLEFHNQRTLLRLQPTAVRAQHTILRRQPTLLRRRLSPRTLGRSEGNLCRGELLARLACTFARLQQLRLAPSAQAAPRGFSGAPRDISSLELRHALL